MKEKDSILILTGVSCWNQEKHTGIEKVNFTVYKGERVYIYGVAGSGTRSLYEILTNIHPAQDGKVEFFGRESVLPEHFPYFPGMRVKDYLCMPYVFNGDTKKAAWKKVRESLRYHWLWEKRSVDVTFLSGYEKSVLLACSAFRDGTDIVVIGNCMQYMNCEEEQLFWKEIDQFAKEQNTAYVCIGDKRDSCGVFDMVYKLTDGMLRRD